MLCSPLLIKDEYQLDKCCNKGHHLLLQQQNMSLNRLLLLQFFICQILNDDSHYLCCKDSIEPLPCVNTTLNMCCVCLTSL